MGGGIPVTNIAHCIRSLSRQGRSEIVCRPGVCWSYREFSRTAGRIFQQRLVDIFKPYSMVFEPFAALGPRAICHYWFSKFALDAH